MSNTFEFEYSGKCIKFVLVDKSELVSQVAENGSFSYTHRLTTSVGIRALMSRNAALEAELAAAKDDYATMLNANMDNVERLTALRAEVEALKSR